MADLRTRREKLEAMANQSASPHEAEIARRLLDESEGPVADRRLYVEWEREADDFLVKMTYRDFNWQPGVLARMLREARDMERRGRIG